MLFSGVRSAPSSWSPSPVLCFWRLLKEGRHIGRMHSAGYLLYVKLHFQEKIGWGGNRAYFIKGFRVELSVCGFSKAPSLGRAAALCNLCCCFPFLSILAFPMRMISLHIGF